MRALIASCALFAALAPAWSTVSYAGSEAASPPAPLVIPPPPAPDESYSWAGFYLRGSGDLQSVIGSANTAPSFGPAPPLPGAGLPSMSSGQIGANMQTGNMVVGVEGDMQWSTQSSGFITGCGIGCSLSDHVKVPWLATLRARAGGAFDRVFIYGTGGLATRGYADSSNSSALSSTPDFTGLSPSVLKWTLGAGMEVALDPNTTAKFEVLRSQRAYTASGALFDANPNDSGKNNIVRGGINYSLPFLSGN